MRRCAFLAILGPFLSLAVTGQLVEVDFQSRAGAIRPLHGVNGGPVCYRGTVDLTEYHRELRIPITRLHDVPWVNAEAVDIHLIFPDMAADPARPENYRFAATDDYIAAITNVQSQIVFRLGESIEHTARKYFVHPPADPHRWAAVCLGIIRHYNHGWAGGFRHGIRHWEIWNEPENQPAMWTGTDEQFLELYTVTAKAIKEAFPEVRVGGPGVGATGEFNGETFRPAAFVGKFLEHCRKHRAPLDFFSWHRYTSQPWDLLRRARAVRQLLDARGFTATESHLNEWNYLPENDWSPMSRQGQGAAREAWFQKMGGSAGAAFAACGLILLQDAPVDVANFYTGEVQGFGLFDFHGVPKRSYYAFNAFREMLEFPERVTARGAVEGETAVLAGYDTRSRRSAIFLSRVGRSSARLTLHLLNRPWPGKMAYQVRVVDETRALAIVSQGHLAPDDNQLEVDLRGPVVALINLVAE